MKLNYCLLPKAVVPPSILYNSFPKAKASLNVFIEDSEYSEDLMRIVAFINKIADKGALKCFFRTEGKYNDGVCALPLLNPNFVCIVCAYPTES